MRVLADITGARKGPGAAFVVGGAGGLADLVAVALLQFETVIVAARPVEAHIGARNKHALTKDQNQANPEPP